MDLAEQFCRTVRPVLEKRVHLCGLVGSFDKLGQAPTWLTQLPSLLSTAELDALQRKIHGATQERMLREMAEALEVLTAKKPLVLVLEDLQWSDYSTLDLLAFLARRREPTRLLLLSTCRPVVGGHPLHDIMCELQAHGQGRELPLGLLNEAHVEEYITARLGVGAERDLPLQSIARVIYQRTEGNPIFMVNVVDDLLAQRLIAQNGNRWELRADIAQMARGVPDNLRQLIEKHFARLTSEEQSVLGAASVAGAEFSVAVVAAAVGQEAEQVEHVCAGLARCGQFLRAKGVDEWPDGTVAGHYEFIHALYQEVLYARLTPGQRVFLHQRVGERKEAGYGEQAGAIAAELAGHFEQGRDYRRAVAYLEKAAENALRRSGYREAITHAAKGLELLKLLPATAEHHKQELALQVIWGALLRVTKGHAAPEAESVHNRALELCRLVGEPPQQLFWVLAGLFDVYLAQGRLHTACDVAEQLFALAQKIPGPVELVWAHNILGIAFSCRGELLRARTHLEQALTLYDAQEQRATVVGVVCRSYLASVLLGLGYIDQAWSKGHEALALAEEQGEPFSIVYALVNLALFHLCSEEAQLAQRQAEAAVALATEQGFAPWAAIGIIARGAALTKQGFTEEGILQMRQGIAVYRATGSETVWPHLLALLAEGYGKAGRVAEGLEMVAEAFTAAHKIGERSCEAELYRLKGELTLQQEAKDSSFPPPDCDPQGSCGEREAEEYFHRAVETARQQQAKLLELRVVMSLARLWRRQGKRAEARQLLSATYNCFTEGFERTTLQEARALLAELAMPGEQSS